MKLNSKVHGIIDYLVVIFLLASPTIFDLAQTTALLTYALGGIHLLLTALTKYELGLINIIPFKIHGTIELLVSILLIAVAFYLGGVDGDVSRNFYLAFAGAVFVTWLATDYKTAK